MKTKFELDVLMGSKKATAMIIGKRPKGSAYLSITYGDGVMANGGNVIVVKDKDLERLAVNILKALKSKKIKK